MKFSTIGYFISDAFKSLKRNRTISIASIATVLTTLFIFGAFLLTALNVKNGVTDVQDKVEVKVFLKDDVTQEQRDAVEAKLKTVQGVKEVEADYKKGIVTVEAKAKIDDKTIEDTIDDLGFEVEEIKRK